MFCFGTARNPDHNSCDCPILKNLGLRIKKHTAADNSDREAALRAAAAASPASGATPPPTNHPPPDNLAGAASAPGAFSASAEQASYDSRDEFDYVVKVDGVMYGCEGKSNSSYAYLSPSCRAVAFNPPSIAAVPVPSHSMGGPSRSMGGPVGVVPVLSDPMGDLSQSMGGPIATRGSARSPQGMGGPTISHTSRDPQGVNTVYPPKTVLALLQNPPRHSLVHFQQAMRSTRTSLPVADTGATDHMLPATRQGRVHFLLPGIRTSRSDGEQLLRPYRRQGFGDYIS